MEGSKSSTLARSSTGPNAVLGFLVKGVWFVEWFGLHGLVSEIRNC